MLPPFSAGRPGPADNPGQSDTAAERTQLFTIRHQLWIKPGSSVVSLPDCSVRYAEYSPPDRPVRSQLVGSVHLLGCLCAGSPPGFLRGTSCRFTVAHPAGSPRHILPITAARLTTVDLRHMSSSRRRSPRGIQLPPTSTAPQPQCASSGPPVSRACQPSSLSLCF